MEGYMYHNGFIYPPGHRSLRHGDKVATLLLILEKGTSTS